MALTTATKPHGRGYLAALILVLVFGPRSTATGVTDTPHENPLAAGSCYDARLAGLRFDSVDSIQDIIADDLRAILVVVLAAVFLYLLVGTQSRPCPGHAQPVLRGLVRLHLRGRVRRTADHAHPQHPSLLGAFQAAGAGPRTASSSAGSSASPPGRLARHPVIPTRWRQRTVGGSFPVGTADGPAVLSATPTCPPGSRCSTRGDG